MLSLTASARMSATGSEADLRTSRLTARKQSYIVNKMSEGNFRNLTTRDDIC